MVFEFENVRGNQNEVDDVYKDCVPSMTTVRYRVKQFKRGRTSVFNNERPGHPIEVTTKDKVLKYMLSY